jgi:hypothetical protein
MTKNENSWDVPIRFLDDEILRLENLQRLDVANARAEGCSWDSIGRVFGVSRQAAQQRFGRYC